VVRAAFRDVRICLTSLCGLTLAASLIPGLSSLAYVSAICGSYEAILSAYEALRQKKLDVNLLMVVAALGAVAVGRVADAAALLFLFSLSTTLEAIAISRTRSAIEDLIKLRPAKAWRLQNGQAEHVPVEELRLGDLIRIPAFDAIPADADVVEGQTRIDQSAMTGESIPTPCGPGERIVAGTQNLEGTLLAKVTAVVGDSALDRIVALVKDAQENKASGERISEWFGQRYTIFVLAVFLLSLTVRASLGQPMPDAFYASLTLLVGMSPCALVISTPATTLSALAWCARNGILVRGGEFIERAGKIRCVALDKTGTLTVGRPALREAAFSKRGIAAGEPTCVVWDGIWPLPEALKAEIGQAAAVELLSKHPVAVAIVDAAQRADCVIPEISDHQVLSGLGVSACASDGEILVGRESLLAQRGITLPACLAGEMERMVTTGCTVSLVATPSGISVLAFADALRPEAKEFVASLRALGVRRIAILTGDRQDTAAAVAKEVGIDEVSAGLLPGEKTGLVTTISESGPVMMVGDGVNDAPSLASASVGVAMGGLGSDIAMNAADVVLVHDRIDRIPDIISLGRRTVGTIRVNLAFAGAVIVGLTVTSLLTRLPLPIAVVGHEGSTVLVILNGLRMLGGPRQPS